MQTADWSEVEIQIFGVELEAFRDLVDRLLELHQSAAHVLDLLWRQAVFLETPDGLAFHELANELDQAQNELDHRSLNVLGIRVPAQGPWRGDALHLAPLPLDAPSLLHTLVRFGLGAGMVAGAPITFLISLMRS